MILDMVEDFTACHAQVLKATACWNCPTISESQREGQIGLHQVLLLLAINCKMATLGDNVSHSDVQRLQRTRRYEARSAIKRQDKEARAIKEDKYLKTLTK